MWLMGKMMWLIWTLQWLIGTLQLLITLLHTLIYGTTLHSMDYLGKHVKYDYKELHYNAPVFCTVNQINT